MTLAAAESHLKHYEGDRRLLFGDIFNNYIPISGTCWYQNGNFASPKIVFTGNRHRYSEPVSDGTKEGQFATNLWRKSNIYY